MNQLVDSPFGTREHAETAGAMQTQSREVAEIQAMAVMAKRFPRNEIEAADRIRNAFTRITLAEQASYQYAKGGTDITGPSIRAAEAIAGQWGNISTGFHETSRGVGLDGVGFSEVKAFAWDMEHNNPKTIQFVVRHWRDKRGGGVKLVDEREIYELTANMAQRRLRNCILALIPGDVTEMAMEQATVTLKAKADTSPEGIKKLLEAFAEFGVTKELIEKRIQRRIDSIQPAQVVGLKRVYVSLRDEMSTPADWFAVEPEASSTGLDAVNAALAAKKAPRKGDQKTGEIASSEGEKPEVKPEVPAKSYAALADEVMHATDADTAALLMDSARDILPADQLADLGKLFRNRWEQK